MRRILLALVSLLALSPAACAWGPAANKLFCQAAVQDVWGQSALGCLDNPAQYCQELGLILNDSMRQQCQDAYASGVEIHPANAPLTLFNDVENHYNYENCPLKWVREGNKWICSGQGNPAREQAIFWFDASGKSDDVCRQVRLFCTGAFYYTSSFFPLHRVKYLEGCLNGPFDDLVDKALASGPGNWTVSEQCTFAYMKPLAGVSRLTTQHVTFVMTEADYSAVLSNLTVAAQYVRNPQLMPATTTTATSTSTTSTTTTLTQPTATVLTTITTQTTTPTIAPTTTTPTTTSPSSTTTQTTTSPTIPTTTVPTTTTSATMTTNEPPTTTQKTVSPEANKSIEQIDSLFGDLVSSINQTQAKQEPKTSVNNIVMLAVMMTVAALSILLLIYLYTAMKRPTMHSSRKVILPPSVRRKMRKGP
ncbi:MAG: hypothetical protein V1875_10360 [Candidatus Altiarchaeota archaeon]